MADDYSQAYEDGREGKGYSGGGSIAYAGWAAGYEARAQQARASSGGGGGGGAINFKGRVVTSGIILGLIGMFFGLSEGTMMGVVGYAVGFAAGALVYLAAALAGRIFQWLPFLPAILMGSLSGAVYGVGVAVRSGRPREALMTQYAVAGTALFLFLWFVWRRLTKGRRSQPSPNT